MHRYEMLTRGSVTYTCDEAEAGDANGGSATEGDDNHTGFATQGDSTEWSSGGDGGSERSTAKPSGRAPAGCAWDLASGTWVRASDTAIEQGGRGAKRQRGQAQCYKE